jgi:hypothetical protein
MAWTHSYSPQAYVDAQNVLETWDKSDLVDALLEYNAQTGKHSTGKELLMRLPMDVLVQSCMDAIEDTRLCDNGGGAMWIDPEGFFRVELP